MTVSQTGVITPAREDHNSIAPPELRELHDLPSSRRRWLQRSPLPGFGAGITVSIGYISVMLLLPLAACFMKMSSLSLNEFITAVWSDRSRSAYLVTFTTSAIAALVNCMFGLLLAWVLVRYHFWGRRGLDALIDLPFALPTAVAGLVFSALFVEQGWYGQILVPLGIQGAYTKLGIVLVMIFVGLPFAVRTIQPVLESLDQGIEEAAASMGASRWQTFYKILLPTLWPAILTGFALSFARGLGEYGAVIFVSGNKPFDTEIAPVLIVARLEQFAYAEATAIAMVLVGFSLASLAVINWLERRSQRYAN